MKASSRVLLAYFTLCFFEYKSNNTPSSSFCSTIVWPPDFAQAGKSFNAPLSVTRTSKTSPDLTYPLLFSF